mmetsp:Transcript_2767/g.7744  ORF Transcript_2767/g.7744 Transcript_2767/m.7744 type:complete len:219 (-) Transcript_2767:26-682(-)
MYACVSHCTHKWLPPEYQPPSGFVSSMVPSLFSYQLVFVSEAVQGLQHAFLAGTTVAATCCRTVGSRRRHAAAGHLGNGDFRGWYQGGFLALFGFLLLVATALGLFGGLFGRFFGHLLLAIIVVCLIIVVFGVATLFVEEPGVLAGNFKGGNAVVIVAIVRRARKGGTGGIFRIDRGALDSLTLGLEHVGNFERRFEHGHLDWFGWLVCWLLLNLLKE